MKKLFISCPMKDRTEAQIRGTMTQIHNIAEAVFGEELDVIQTYIPDPPSGTNQAAKAYGIPSYTINLNYVARDVVEARAKEARKYSCFGY